MSAPAAQPATEFSGSSRPHFPRKGAKKGSKISAKRLDRLAKLKVSFIASDSFSLEEGLQESNLGSLIPLIEEESLSPPTSSTHGLESHLTALCATPLLTPEEEQALFRRMNYCKFRAKALQARLKQTPNLASEIEDCLGRAEKIRNHIIQANTRLVMSLARKLADTRNAFDDLLSQGITSLVYVVEKFDYERGYRFSTYATCAVRRDLYRFVMKRKKDLDRFQTGAGDRLDACQDLREPFRPNAEGQWRRLSSAVSEMLGELDEREQFIIMRRYGLAEEGSGRKASYSRLGEKLGISKERVRQLANRAMDKLRERATDRRLESIFS